MANLYANSPWKSCRPLKGLEGSNPSFSAKRKVLEPQRFQGFFAIHFSLLTPKFTPNRNLTPEYLPFSQALHSNPASAPLAIATVAVVCRRSCGLASGLPMAAVIRLKRL